MRIFGFLAAAALMGGAWAFGWAQASAAPDGQAPAAPGAATSTAPAPPGPAPGPGDETRQQRAAYLLRTPQWTDSEGVSYGRLIVNFADTRAMFFQATRSPTECQRQTRELVETRAVIQQHNGGAFESWMTPSTLATVRADAQRMACPSVTTQIDGLIADRRAWAARRQQPSAGASPGEQCAHLSVFEQSRCLAYQVNRRVNGAPSPTRDACYRALTNDMRRTNGQLPNYRERAEACRRIR